MSSLAVSTEVDEMQFGVHSIRRLSPLYSSA